MTWAVVIKNGDNLNASLSSIEYNRYGQRTKQPVIICDDWAQGFKSAVDQKFKQALFLEAGTVFLDWQQWQTFVDSYPHQGLVAHLIWHPGTTLKLDSQCWFMDLPLFDAEDFSRTHHSHPLPVASNQHIHDDYTPLWVRPGNEPTAYHTDGFGQGLIERQLQRGRAVVNWNKPARDLKWFLYPGQTDVVKNFFERMQNYLDLAQNQLWVLNNETTRISTGNSLLCPGAGLVWMLNIIQPNIKNLQVVDISHRQIEFCKELWNNWSGTDYGSFVWNFIQNNRLQHFEIDQADLGALERLQLKKQSKFVEHVNKKFAQIMSQHGIEGFSQQWTQAQQHKQPNFSVGNIVDWVLNHSVNDYDSIWCSNILTYKWTLLHNTKEQFQEFENKIQSLICI